MSWARFVLLMRQRGVTHLLHEIDTYSNPAMPMQMYAEMNGQCIGVYNPHNGEGKVLTSPWKTWNKRARQFDRVSIK